MSTFPSQRGVKPEEQQHRLLDTNLIGTLSTSTPTVANSGVWVPSAAFLGLTLGQALTTQLANGGPPLLWALQMFPMQGANWFMYTYKFGFDLFVPSLAVAGAQAKIGHVALISTATISGEIIPAGGAWELDNNSGAWGSMANHDGKSRMMDNAAQVLSHCDPGGIVVTARRAYSRTDWKRAIQQQFR